MKPKLNEELKTQIEKYLLDNIDIPTKRQDLAIMFRTNDSQIRTAIGEIRKKYPVINHQDNKGYLITYKKDLLDREIAQEKSRANNIYRNIKVLEFWRDKDGTGR